MIQVAITSMILVAILGALACIAHGVILAYKGDK